MLKPPQKNKFEEAISELTRLCDKCEHKEEEIGCPHNRGCDKFNAKFNEFNYGSLYPMHPCKECIVRPICVQQEQCDKYIHHENMKAVAESELRGHPNLISDEDLKQTIFNGESIKDLKNDPDYPEILKTEKQRLEYFYKYKFIKNVNGRWIIDPRNSAYKKQMKKAATTYVSSDHLKLINCFFS